MDSAQIPADFFDGCVAGKTIINLKTEKGEEHRGCQYIGHNPEVLGVIRANLKGRDIFPFHDLIEITIHEETNR